MPEIKRTFTAGKMNKDLDERLVQNGEYRDALNIKVRTTDGDSSGIGNAGVVQNIKGTDFIGEAYKVEEYKVDDVVNALSTKFVGSVSDEKNDKAYFFAAAPLGEDGFDSILHTHIMTKQVTNEQAALFEFNNPDVIEELDTLTFSPNTLEEHASVMDPVLKHWVDSIIEVDALTETSRPIFVDKFGVTGRWVDVIKSGEENIPNSNFSQLEVTDGAAFRIGMIVYLYNNDGDHLLFGENNEFGVEILDIQENTLILATEQSIDLYNEWQAGNINWKSAFKFIYPERVLEFDYNKLIPNINILDNLLFYTDGINEPKKINITRALKGTIIPKLGPDSDMSIVQSAQSYLENPKHTKLFVNNTTTDALPEFVDVAELEWSLSNSDIKKEHITVIRKAPISPPTLFMNDTARQSDVNFSVEGIDFFNAEDPAEFGDTVVITNQTILNSDIRVNDVLRFSNAENTIEPVVITGRVIDISETQVTIKLLFVGEDLEAQDPSNWEVRLEQDKPLFETKFGRVGYRYQYDDNEYSSFSPWSELAFLPGTFSYTPKNGHNEGMSNTVRELIIRDFIPDDSIRPSDVKKVDILWKTTDDQNVYIVKSITRARDKEWDVQDNETTGYMTLTSEMIHRVLSSKQLLRNWDNVPKTAITQEITASRLVFGNYTQGYDINRVVSLKQAILSETVSFPEPKKSIKSIRSYKFGVVFGDKYGRETPVIAQGYKTNDNQTATGEVSVDKSLAHLSNKFKITQDWESSPENWMEYAKYYVKETSNEYYNLILDRWYNAGDGTLWLSFPSVDRNKVDEETYLILKNEHGNQNPVSEKARYKILAIENEAPDYIKTDYRKMAKVPLDNIGVYGPTETTSTGVPTGILGTLEIRTNLELWNDIPINITSFKGTPRVRIVGELVSNENIRAEGPWRTVSRIHAPENSDRYGCDISEAFTATDVNMASLLSIQDPTIVAADVELGESSAIQYYMEFRDEVVENKPEFDGRFFVKINKDDMLAEKILNLSTNTSYNTIKTYDIAYIAAKSISPADVIQSTAGYTNVNDPVFPTYAGWTSSTIEGTVAADELNEDFQPQNNNEGLIPSFGPGNSNLTENFWLNWYNDDDGGQNTKIFIDEAPAYSHFDFSQTNDEEGQIDGTLTFNMANPNAAYNDYVVPVSILRSPSTQYARSTWSENELAGWFPPFEAPNGLIRNWHPAGLNQGAAPSGQMGEITFSTIGFQEGFGNGIEGSFKTDMQTVGTHFRFVDDPFPNVYKIIPMQLDYTEAQGYSGLVDISSKNYNSDNALSKRHSIVTRFVRLDPETGSEMYVGDSPLGIDTFNWDPRGLVKHNGIGSFKIEIIEPAGDGGLVNDAIVENKACWETEPKKDLDIDIYYEASGAIPMNLNNKANLIVFTKPNRKPVLASNVKVLPRKLTSNIESVNIDSSAWVWQCIGNDAIAIAEGTESFPTELITDVQNVDTAVGIAINDLITFTHPNGLVTQSKVLNHLKALDVTDNGEYDTAVLSDRVTSGNTSFSLGQSTFTPFGVVIENINVGDEVIGNGVEQGTFVTGVNPISFPAEGFPGTVSINKSFISSQENVSLTFINVTGWYKIDTSVWQYPVELAWFNCYSFGNAVESDRIRDDFNAPTIDNGIKVSSIFLDYKEEKIKSGLIHSSELYNAVSSVNGLNEFSMAEKITKNINPIYGSIQALKTRDTDLVTFCEDKVLKVLANKDAVFNADGNAQLTATNKVLGQTVPFAGDYGISKNPESLSSDQYRLYFTDKQRGAVLRLSMDGLTPISNVGMKSWFRENLVDCKNIIGTFDWENGEYNVTLDYTEVSQKSPITVSFNEGSKGWVSFKSFIPNCGTSVSGKYLTSPSNTHDAIGPNVTYKVFKHNSSEIRNRFYDDNNFKSEIEITFNDLPDVVKSFKAMNYEGTQGKVLESTNLTTPTFPDALGNFVSTDDNEFYNLSEKLGWFVQSFNTDINSGTVPEFRKKEGKWFNRIFGSETSFIPDGEEIFVQGIGFPVLIGETPSSDTETQTEADLEIEAQTLELNNSSVVYTILFDPLFETYAIQINSVNNITSTSEFLEIYNFELEQNLQDGSDLIPISTNDPFTSNLTVGYYPMTVTEINDPNNSIQFLIIISANVNYDNINS